MIKGQVWDLSGNELIGAHAYNVTKHYGTFTDASGIFFLVMTPGDSLRVSMIGFKPFKMRIPSALSAQSYKLDVTLIGDTIILKTAEIRAYPATYAEFKREFLKLRVPEESVLNRTIMPNIDYGSKYALPEGGGLLLPGPIGLLYNTFSKEGKELKKMNVILTRNRLRDELLAIVSRNVLEKEFGLKSDEEIDEMMKHCGITKEFLKSNSDYLIINHILQCYKRKNQ